MDDERKVNLLCQISKAGTIQQITDLTYYLLGNPIFIQDMAHTMLAYTQCINVPHDTWQQHVVEASLTRNTLKQSREISAVHDASTENRMPVLVNDSNIPFPRIVKTIVHNGWAIGVMVLTAYFQPFGPSDIELIELISAFVGPCLQKDRFHISANERTIENYFIKLLDGAEYSREQIGKRLNLLGWKSSPYMYLLSLGPEDDSGTGNSGLKSTVSSFSELTWCSFFYNNNIICVYGSDDEIHQWENDAPALNDLLRRCRLAAGVSRRFSGMENFQEYYRQAQCALSLGIGLGRRQFFFPYDTFTVFHMFNELPHSSLYRFCHIKIRDLDEYDRVRNTQFCITLQVYLENTRNLSRTAEILYVHRNTVRYRINKCMQLLKSDLEDGNEVFAFILSLRILEFEKKLRP